MRIRDSLSSRRIMIWSFVLLAGLAPTVYATEFDVGNPANVLAGPGRTINVSSVVSVPSLAIPGGLIDNLAAGSDQDGSFLFGQADSPNRLSISGFNYGVFKTIRIFTAADPTRDPTSITVKSSTSLVSTLVAGDYETTLGTFTFSEPPSSAIPMLAYPVPGAPDPAVRGYYDLVLGTASPVGTQSLFMSLVAPVSGIRIYELQALAVPEPASLSLLAGAMALVLSRRRSRAA